MIWRRPIVPALVPETVFKPRHTYRIGHCAHAECDEPVADPGLWVWAGHEFCSPTCARRACGSY